MRMTLNRLQMENFKGCRQLEIDFSAGKTEIRGANGTGKTTIVDAFCWVLWNTDSYGNAPGSDNFREKPLDENGQTVHNLDTTVELSCTLDGSPFDLKRTQAENWVKKRGSAEATFQGNVSTYWINGVETKQQDFKARINGLANSEVLRLVGALSAFNQLEWRKRRQQLLELAGSDVDSELLCRDEYRPIADEIASRGITADELRKVLADSRKSINKELQMLPIRIDEASKSIQKLNPDEIKDAEYIVDDTRKDIEKIDQQIIDAKAGSEGASLRAEILAAEQECISIKRRILDEHEAERRRLQNAADAASTNFRQLSALTGETKKIADALLASINTATVKRDALREQYMEVKRRPVEVSDTCPTCGQTLPQDRVADARQKAEAEKQKSLNEIKASGKAVAVELEQLDERWADAKNRLDEAEGKAKEAQEALEAANAAVRDFPKYPDEKASKALEEAELRLEALRSRNVSSPDEKVRALMERKGELQALIDSKLKVLSTRDLVREAEQRIKAYEARQKDLGVELSENDRMTILAEQFVQDRCGALEDSINSLFPTVRWKLFDTQINGGIVDACMCMIDCDGVLVPYESANTASQIAADVEIVDVLSDHYDIRMPLFIDNAERINSIPHIDSQTITLSVSSDSGLNIEEA